PSPAMSKPLYRIPITDTTFNGIVTRIADDAGRSLYPAYPDSVWRPDARHRYSKDQPWNADGSLLAIHNTGGGAAAWVYLDGSSYALQNIQNRTNIAYTDWRWHPTLPNVQIVV